jgi:two-component system, cell cycle sensor histidine kinase and response regulator CckA
MTEDRFDEPRNADQEARLADALAALRESETRYRLLFETSQDAIYVARLDGSLIDANQATADLFGYDSREQLIRDWNAVDHFQDPADRERAREALFRDGSIHDEPLALRSLSGEELRVLVTASVLRDGEGGAMGYQAVVRDLTHQQRLEHQLVQVQKMEAVGQLAGGIAHDFNNLLTVITGYCDLIVGAIEDPDLARDLGEVQAAAHKATKLTEQLLAFSRRRQLQPQVLDLNESVRGFQGFLQRTLGSDVEVAIDLDDRLAPVLADPGQIEQVLMNLAVNAREAMPAGGRLEIGSRNELLGPLDPVRGEALRPGRYAVLTVQDTGVGMDRATKASAFEPFFTTKEGKGTGLGLATVYGIVRQSGGHVWIDSEPGEGTCFTIYLPHVDGQVEAVAEGEARDSAKGGTETVLLVEDDDAVREFARRCLEREGYAVLTARNAAAAREAFEARHGAIDLMITDLVMPRGDGVSLADDVSLDYPKLKILLMSGFADRALERRRPNAATYPLLTKPFASDELVVRVRQILDGPPADETLLGDEVPAE